jgi:glycosyltransferase involved in cell wall biosynthesis
MQKLRFLGFKVQGGASSEANVFATLLGNRGDEFDARVAYHAWGKDDGLARFRDRSRAEIVPVDMGLRPGELTPSAISKVATILKYRGKFGKLIAAAGDYRPDVVYSSQQLWDSALASSVSRALGVPHVVHLHFNVGPWLSTGFSPTPRLLSAIRGALRLADPLETIRSCARVLTVSEFIRQQVIDFGVAPDRVTTLHNAMKTSSADACARGRVRAAFGVDPDAVVLAHVGTLLQSKGQVETIDAFSTLAAKYPRARMFVVGEGPARPQIEARINQHGLRDRITLTGQRSDVPDLLAAADIFAHPSLRDPFPLAVLEGLAAGLPVLAWADGGVPEQFVDGEAGFLLPPGDVGALANALERLLADPALRARMGDKGREHLRLHGDPSEAAAKFAKVLRQVAGRS